MRTNIMSTKNLLVKKWLIHVNEMRRSRAVFLYIIRNNFFVWFFVANRYFFVSSAY